MGQTHLMWRYGSFKWHWVVYEKWYYKYQYFIIEHRLTWGKGTSFLNIEYLVWFVHKHRITVLYNLQNVLLRV